MRAKLICTAFAAILCLTGPVTCAWGVSLTLHEAAIAGATARLESLLAAGADVNAADHNDCTPLHYAAIYDHEDVATILVAHGADVNAKGHWNDDTPLHDAAEHGHAGVAKVLIAHGGNVDARNEGGWTPLHTAARGGHVDIIELLLDHGAQVDLSGSWGETPLLVAVDEDQLAAATVLVAHDAEVNVQGTKYRYATTPLHMAIWIADHDMVELLVTHGADVNLMDEDGYSPLHSAACSLNREIVELLIAHGADVHARSGYGGTPLRYAAQYGYVPVAEALIQAGARVDGEDEPRTPAVWAMLSDERTMVEFLVGQGARVTLHMAVYIEDVNRVTTLIVGSSELNLSLNELGTPLHIAARAGNSEIVRLLIAAGAKLDVKGGSYAYTPLQEAIGHKHSEVAAILIDAGADITLGAAHSTPLELAISSDQRDIVDKLLERSLRLTLQQAAQLGDMGAVERQVAAYTGDDAGDYYSAPLLAAAGYGHADIVEFLLAQGAVVDAAGAAGQWTVLHEAAYRGHADVAEVLLAHGANANIKASWSGQTPLHYAAARHHTDVAEALLAHGADVNSQATDGRTPLHEAAKLGFTDMVELLLAKGANVEMGVTDNWETGLTPLHEAVLSGNADVVRLLIAAGADTDATYGGECYTALGDAFDMGFAEIVGLLGGDPNDPALTGRGPYSVIIANPQKVRQFLSFEGIHYDEAWIPEQTDLNGLDGSLRSFLTGEASAQVYGREYVLSNLRRYCREYSGFEHRGSRYIICNMFLFWGMGTSYVSDYGGPSGGEFTIIYDGGCGVVRVIFDVRTRTIVSIDCNGEA